MICSRVSSRSILYRFCTRIGPLSIFASTRCTVTPPSVSPLASVQKLGMSPRYFGSSAPWQLIMPWETWSRSRRP